MQQKSSEVSEPHVLQLVLGLKAALLTPVRRYSSQKKQTLHVFDVKPLYSHNQDKIEDTHPPRSETNTHRRLLVP
jgi:hypothetical protein